MPYQIKFLSRFLSLNYYCTIYICCNDFCDIHDKSMPSMHFHSLRSSLFRHRPITAQLWLNFFIEKVLYDIFIAWQLVFFLQE